MTWWRDAWSEWQGKQIRGFRAQSRGLPGGIPSLLVLFLASGFLSGFIPALPGTAGTLVALIIYWVLIHRLPPLPYLVLLLASLLLGSALCSRAEAYLGKADAAPIVWDEWVGLWTALALLPMTPLTLGAGFLLFRLFDIVKPPPLRRLQSLPGGWGVMADDLGAGIYANLLLRVLLGLMPG